jgi:hypothetical protein
MYQVDRIQVVMRAVGIVDTDDVGQKHRIKQPAFRYLRQIYAVFRGVWLGAFMWSAFRRTSFGMPGSRRNIGLNCAALTQN